MLLLKVTFCTLHISARSAFTIECLLLSDNKNKSVRKTKKKQKYPDYETVYVNIK